MAEDMYSYIQVKPAKKRKDLSVAVIAAIGAALLLFFICTMVNTLSNIFIHRDFTASLSESTVYAYENNCLYAETAEGTLKIKGENGYSLYYLFSSAKGREQTTIPDSPPFVTLDYGNGGVLQCWKVYLEDGVKRDNGLFWIFTDPEGNCWMFDSDTFSIANVERLVSRAANLSKKAQSIGAG